MLKKANLVRWRPRPHAQRTASTPRVRSSGAASHLDLFEHPAMDLSSRRRAWLSGDPEDRGDFAEFAPELPPGIAAVVAAIEIPVAAGREDGVGGRGREAHRPHGGVRLDRQAEALPCRA